MNDRIDPPTPAAFYGYLGTVIGLAVLAIALLYFLFRSGFRAFTGTFFQAPVETVRADPLVLALLVSLFVCLAVLVAVIVGFGARVDRVDVDP
ncbi:MAG: hypothetical protein V5A55_02795 [Halovenus sp.]